MMPAACASSGWRSAILAARRCRPAARSTSRRRSRRAISSLNLIAPKIDGVAAALRKDLARRGESMSAPCRAAVAGAHRCHAQSRSAAQVRHRAASRQPENFRLKAGLATCGLRCRARPVGVIAEPEKANLRLDARVASDDGALISVLGLDRFAPAERRAVNLTLTANGPLNGDMRVDAKIAGEGFDLAGAGTLEGERLDAGGRAERVVVTPPILRRCAAPARRRFRLHSRAISKLRAAL